MKTETKNLNQTGTGTYVVGIMDPESLTTSHHSIWLHPNGISSGPVGGELILS